MSVPGVQLGERLGPFAAQLGHDFLAEYAAAIRDPSAAARHGDVALPVALVTKIWEAQEAGRVALTAREVQSGAVGGVHGEHELLLHRPVEVDDELRVFVTGQGARASRDKSFVTLRYSMLDARDDLVAEQWWTTVYFGVGCVGVGEPPPDHTFPEPARDAPLGVHTVRVDGEMTRAYAAVSDDWSAHHFEVAAARASGFDRVFLHGLCTMALCAQGVTRLAAGGDPTRLRRLSVRFAAPTFLDEDLHVHLYDAGHLGIAFEADCAGSTVIAHGRAELFG
jgi:acyl dehydratase